MGKIYLLFILDSHLINHLSPISLRHARGFGFSAGICLVI